MKILLVGGNGFIGSRLCTALSRANFQVTIASRNPRTNQIKLQPWSKLNIEPNQFDIIINAAGKYGVQETEDEIKSTFEANVGVCVSIGHSLHLVSKGLINLSSYFELLDSNSNLGKTYYVKSKTLGNNLLEFWSNMNQKHYSRIVLFDNYDEDLSRGKLLDQLIRSSLTGKSISIRNTENALNLLSLDTVTNSMLRIVESYKTFEPQVGRIEVKNSITYKISDLLDRIQTFSKKQIDFTNLNEAQDLELQSVILEKNSYQLSIKEDIDIYLRNMLALSV
jgi:nucleoside-diphosphate-sugar epimerase